MEPAGVTSFPSSALRCLALAVSLCACAPKMHRIEPYRNDPQQAAALAARARALCESPQAGARTAPGRPFFTDGCTAWFDRSWAECCVTHDIQYWCGGSASERKRADEQLHLCVSEAAPGWLARITYWGVRVGGHPLFPFHYRWGFGRSYLPWYDDPAEAQPGSTRPARAPTFEPRRDPRHARHRRAGCRGTARRVSPSRSRVARPARTIGRRARHPSARLDP